MSTDQRDPRDRRIPIMMSAEELDAVDSWRFENRVATRSEAIRRLCQIGIAAQRSAPGIISGSFAIATAALKEADQLDTIAREGLKQVNQEEFAAKFVDYIFGARGQALKLLPQVVNFDHEISALMEAPVSKELLVAAQEARKKFGDLVAARAGEIAAGAAESDDQTERPRSLLASGCSTCRIGGT